MRAVETGSPEPTVHERASLRGVTNAAFLIASFGIGQGSIFVVQSWLINRGELDLLAHFGTLFSFAILAMMIVDCGAVTTVARRVSLADPRNQGAEIRRCYWQATVMRLCFAAVISLICLCYSGFADDVFNRSYVISAVPALLLWSFNANGLLDGLRLSGLSGLTGVSTYAMSAIALVVACNGPSETAGFLLGSALSAGVVLCVAMQLIILGRLGHVLVPQSMGWRQGLVFVREGLPALLAVVPGQLSFRFQIVVCSLFLGEDATALLLYSRQIAVAVSQVLEFVRRAHFPLLVRVLSNDAASLRTVFRTQRLATWLALLLSLGLLGVGILAARLLDGPAAGAAMVVALFSTGVFTGALLQTLSQAGQALGRFNMVAWAANASMLVGFAASTVLAWQFGFAGLALAEVLAHAMAALLLYLTVFRLPLGHRGAAVVP